MKKIILLTGASGFFGKEIFNKLKKKYKVLTPNSKKLNLLNKSSISNYLKENKIDIIINAAWKINSTFVRAKLRKSNYLKNIKIAQNLVHESKSILIKYFLNISSINAYKKNNYKLREKDLLKFRSSQSDTPEGLAKLFLINQFNYLPKNDFQYKNLLFSNIYGFNKSKKNLSLVDKIYQSLYLKKKHIILLSKKDDIKIDLIYIKDAVRAVDFFLSKLIKNEIDHQIINIGSGKGCKIGKLIDIISNKNNLTIKYFVNKNKKNLIASINLAKKYGWKPKYLLIDGINEITKKHKKIKE